MFQIARGSGATLKTLKITKSVKTTVNTEVYQDNSQHRVVYATQTGAKQAFNRSRKFVKTTDYTELFTWQARQALDRSRKAVNTKITCKVVYMAKTKARQSTRQVK